MYLVRLKIMKIFQIIFLSWAFALGSTIHAQNDLSTEQISDSIYVIFGQGGNIGILLGDDGTFMIDDKFANLSKNILSAIESIGGDTPKYLLNTHFHGDHTGGNIIFGKAGTTIVSHHNVRKRLVEGYSIPAFNKNTPPALADALQEITYSTNMTLHLNDETIQVFHTPGAHTDGDSFVYFENANVIHTGDLFFNGFFPFIDVHNGGNVQGMINAADQMLEIANDNTKIIPGHGPIASVNDLRAFREMLLIAQQRLHALKVAGKSADEAVAEKPLEDLDAQWGGGFLPTDKWIQIIYDSI